MNIRYPIYEGVYRILTDETADAHIVLPLFFRGGKRKGTARYGTGKMQPSGKPGSLQGHTLPVRGGRQAPSVMSPERQVQDKQPVWRQDSSHNGKT